MRRRRRGLSLGTVLVLLLCVFAVGGFLWFMRTVGQDSPAAAMRLDEIAQAVSEVILAPRDGAATPRPTAGQLMQVAQEQGSPPPQAAVQPISLSLTVGGVLRLDGDVLASDSYKEGGQELLAALARHIHADLSLVALDQDITEQAPRNDSAMPAAALPLLKAAGVDAAVYSQGSADQALTAAGLRPLGGPAEEVKGLRLNGLDIAWLHSADSELPGGTEGLAQLEQRIAGLKAEHDLVVLSVKWPTVTSQAPSAQQVTLAHRLAHAGADVILGFGGGQVQQVEVYQLPQGDGQRDILIAYSMGTLLTENRAKAELLSGMLLHMQLQVSPQGAGMTLEGLQYTPTYVRKWTEKGRTRFAVLPAAGDAPADMSNTQKDAMARSRDLIQAVMRSSPAQLQR